MIYRVAPTLLLFLGAATLHAQVPVPAYPGVDHPLVRTHPETGKRAILYGGGFMRHVVGLAPHESDAVLRMVREHVEQPKFHCRWSWRVDDLAIWDERATIHRAIGDHYPRVREVRRCVVDGDRPYLDLARDAA